MKTNKIDWQEAEHFIRTKIEEETWSDKQVALLLGVGPSTFTFHRRQMGIKPANKFVRRFNEKYAERYNTQYGSDAVSAFRAMVQQKISLQDIGISFGFSREYARQVYRQLYPTRRRYPKPPKKSTALRQSSDSKPE